MSNFYGGHLTPDEKEKALDEDFFIRNAIHCWLYYFDEKHKWHSIYKDLGKRESFIGKPEPPKPRRARRATRKPTKGV